MHHLRESPKDRVEEGSRAQGEPRGLLNHRLDDGRVAMPLVHRRVGGEHVDVLLALDVPDLRALSAVDDDGKWVVAVVRRPSSVLWVMSGA